MSDLIHLTRVYDAYAPFSSPTFLIDRLWPRGISKTRLEGVEWFKDIAPSSELRKWFHAEPERWSEFVDYYRNELAQGTARNKLLALLEQKKTITLLYGSKDAQHNHAIVLRNFLLERLAH
ncbi:DUF488 domain-containing protein [Pectobacterium parmentieri]|uniref:DUF488 domain-containing protein n=1 Tax=Pectobacterium parmentieri TaxID=1905730 RepID=A0A8B3FH65_PECPM|nr:DUF488 family protein [Pectobacterium parmentieri]AOR57435.1 MarR family transcriptional regulator [Pectobacterium parmentieri]AYH07001.1 DUF488 domain-containing protein [Pectobacterium parmentieri]AYH11524.1 DUF488 domain-containing protein [Pectobacterium parmentieri]AYH15812.1 DUF488 domain-containing protein [Pectobacterium parmentieri]AYH17759.1 DUF488 domain-containing protein [Pectobacterium parmentieri]